MNFPGACITMDIIYYGAKEVFHVDNANYRIQGRVRNCSALMQDMPSKLIYLGQVYYNITGDYAHIAKMLRSLYLEHRECIR